MNNIHVVTMEIEHVPLLVLLVMFVVNPEPLGTHFLPWTPWYPLANTIISNRYQAQYL